MKQQLKDSNKAASQDIGAAHARLRELAVEHQQAERSRDQIWFLQQRADELPEQIDKSVDEAAALFAREYSGALLTACSLRASGDQGRLTISRPSLLQLPPIVGPMQHAFQCFIHGDQIKAKLKSFLPTLITEPGAPWDERPALYDAAVARVRALEDEHADLVDALAALDPPIVVPHLPSVQRRLDDERAQAARDADNPRFGQGVALKKRFDDGYAKARRMTESAYLGRNIIQK